MILKMIFVNIIKIIIKIPYSMLDYFYVKLDKKHIRRAKNIRLIPEEKYRKGGKYSYAEWAHVIGIFQTLINIYLDKTKNNKILDVGCGTGLLAIASEPFLVENGEYIGIDVIKKDIDFCKKHYKSQQFSFIHLNINNQAYAPRQQIKRQKWELYENSFDLVTALSVWTHLDEEDASFYFKEVARVLKSGGKAIVTFFLLDEIYEKNLNSRVNKKSRYHMTKQDKWIFDCPAYNSNDWFYPKWVKIPEFAIGVTSNGLNRLLIESRLKKVAVYPGNWKELPGVFFQDIVILEK